MKADKQCNSVMWTTLSVTKLSGRKGDKLSKGDHIEQLRVLGLKKYKAVRKHLVT